VQITRKRAERSHRFRGALCSYGDKDLLGADINPGCIGLRFALLLLFFAMTDSLSAGT
jgi:hypothetical protein